VGKDSLPARTPRRVGDEERHACVELLTTHHAHGRLSQDEFEERLGLALTARTAGQLGRLLVDLPVPESAAAGLQARWSERAYLGWVGAGVLLMVLTWMMIVIMLAVEEFDAALAVGAANVAGVVAPLLVIRGIRARRALGPGHRPGERP
jgi:Domain of unknown function (DUF1707)